MFLIPAEMITRVSNKVLVIDPNSTRGFRNPAYNPTLIDDRSVRNELTAYDRAYGSYYSGYGQLRGRGPRGYRRSNERIMEEINDRLSDRGDLDASDIEVTVTNCDVTLSGNVENRRGKRLAENIAEDVSGVQNVENRLRVKQSGRDDLATSAPATERPISDTATDAAKASR